MTIEATKLSTFDVQLKEGNYVTRTAGTPGNPTIMFLHGFPESSIVWKEIMLELAGLGFYTVAFDQRGYSPQARPAELSAYKVANLVDDVAGIADELNIENFHLVGHDWGSLVGWSTAQTYPHRVTSFTAMAIGHPAAFLTALKKDFLQGLYSRSYFAFFRTPKLFEYFAPRLLNFVWGANRSATRKELRHIHLQRSANGTLGITGALNWYRGNGVHLGAYDPRGNFISPVKVPSIFIWGNKDPIARRYHAELTAEFVEADYRLVELDTDHFIIQRERDKVREELLSLIGRTDERFKETLQISSRSSRQSLLNEDREKAELVDDLGK